MWVVVRLELAAVVFMVVLLFAALVVEGWMWLAWSRREGSSVSKVSSWALEEVGVESIESSAMVLSPSLKYVYLTGSRDQRSQVRDSEASDAGLQSVASDTA